MLKKIFIPIAIFLAIIVLLSVLVIVLHWRTNLISDALRDTLNDNLGQVAHIEYTSLSGDLFQEVHIKDLRVNFRNGITVASNQVDVTYSLFSSISSRFYFDDIFVDSLRIEIPESARQEKDTVNTENFEFIRSLSDTAGYKSFLAGLPDARLGNLEIKHGYFHIPESNLTVDSVHLVLSGYVNPSSFDVRLRRLAGVLREPDIRLNELVVRVQGDSDQINVNGLNLSLPGSFVAGSGMVSFTEQAELLVSIEDSHLDYSDIKGLFFIEGIDTGLVTVDCHVMGRPDKFSFDGRVSGRLGDYEVENFYLFAAYEPGVVRITDGLLQMAGARLGFKGRIAENNTDLKLSFNNINSSRFYEAAPVTDLNGTLSVQMKQLRLFPLNGNGKLVLYESLVDSLPIDSLQFALKSVNNDLEIIEPSFLKIADRVRFNVKGTLDHNYVANLQMTTENMDLESMSTATGIDTMRGSLDANLYVTGRIFDPNMMGFMWLPEFRTGEVSADSMILQVEIENLLSNPQGDAYFSMSSSRFGPVDFRESRADVVFDSNVVYIDTLFFANGPNFISAFGEIKFDSDTMNIVFEDFRIFYEDYWIDNQGKIIVRSDPEEVLIEQAVLVAPDEGRLEIRGYWDRIANEMETGLFVRNIHVEPLKQFIKKDIDISGIIEGDFEVSNPQEDLELDIRLRGIELQVDKAPLGTISCAFTYARKKFYFDEFVMTHDDASIRLDGDIAFEVGGGLLETSQADLSLTWQEINLQKYTSLFNMTRTLTGKTSGQLALTGTLSEPLGSLRINIEKLGYEKFLVDSAVVLIRIEKDGILLDKFLADINSTEITAHGRQTIDPDLTRLDSTVLEQPIDIYLESNDDSLEFIGFLTDQVERLHGAYNFSTRIQGTLARPVMTEGSFKMEQGILELSRVKNPITEVAIDASIDSSILEIHEFSGFSQSEKSFFDRVIGVLDPLLELIGLGSTDEGMVTGKGTVNLASLTHPVVDLSIEMNKFYVDYFVENTQLVLSTNNLHVTGRDTLMVTGDMTVSGRYVPELEKLKKNLYLSRKEIKPGGRMLGYDLNISMPGNFIISSSTFDLANNFQFDMLGDLRVIREPGSDNLELIGNLDINSGKYGSWGQDFEIQTGKIIFSDPNVINPDLEILAEKSSRGLIFELSMQGNLERQQMDLQVRDMDGQYLNYTMSDKVTLLSLGTTVDQLSSSSLATAGEDVINTSVETAFSRGAETVTGLDKVSIDMKGSMVDLQSMKLNNGLKEASLSLGKYIFSNLYLEYTSQMGGGTIPTPKLSWEPGNQIGLKYRINRNWSVDSNYSQTQRGNDMIQISLSWRKTF